eukprot:TRINITY_DN230_c0_g1_i1.p1 TRINITY_DN230_c0_g1~~TRINITY_DN230_c0_g1_i1.p1  ORF type:complete len:155 (+),score=6.83 TRINITY_DN230_c0_g1_i1:201-665(+)
MKASLLQKGLQLIENLPAHQTKLPTTSERASSNREPTSTLNKASNAEESLEQSSIQGTPSEEITNTTGETFNMSEEAKFSNTDESIYNSEEKTQEVNTDSGLFTFMAYVIIILLILFALFARKILKRSVRARGAPLEESEYDQEMEMSTSSGRF